MYTRNVSESIIKMKFTEILKYFEVYERQISPSFCVLYDMTQNSTQHVTIFIKMMEKEVQINKTSTTLFYSDKYTNFYFIM
jgi:hypothetical protein